MFWIQNSSLSCSSVRSSWITIQMTSHDHQWIISGALSVLTFACRLTWVFAANIKNRHRDKTFNCSVETVHSSRLSHTHLHLSASSPLPASFHPHLYIFNTLPEKYTVIHIHDLFMFMHALRRWKAIISCLSYLLLALWVCVVVCLCVCVFCQRNNCPSQCSTVGGALKEDTSPLTDGLFCLNLSSLFLQTLSSFALLRPLFGRGFVGL